MRGQHLLLLLTTDIAPASNVKRDDENLGSEIENYMAMLSNGKGKQPAVDSKASASAVIPDQTKPRIPPTKDEARRPSIGKKVSFAQDPEINLIPPRESNIPNFALSTLNNSNSTRTPSVHPTKHMIIVDDDFNAIGSEPLEVVDTSKLAQEARENMNGIGAIVASMTIDNMTDDDEDDYDDDGSEELDDVDWRTLDRAPIGADLEDDSYKSYIEGLMKKHEAAFENVGPRHDESLLESLASSGTAAAPIKSSLSKVGSNRDQDKAPSGQKGVRFANELDVQEAPAPAANLLADSQAALTPFSENVLERSTSKKSLVNSVVERTGSTGNSAPAPPHPKKVSRFKAARSGG